MIHYIKGCITVKGIGYVVVENNAVGYEINVPATSKAYLADPSDIITMYTAMIVREDDIRLYGFTDTVSLEIFRKLLSVSGVGAKAALAILSALTADEIRKAIAFNDPQTITRAQGIGKKIAQRIVLELKDKLDDIAGLDASDNFSGADPVSGGSMNSINEATEALVSLGYSKAEALEAIAATGLSDAAAEEYIKAALKNLSLL